MANLKVWIEAARLRTLPLALAGIFTGSALAIREGSFNPIIFGLALLTATFLQVLSNLANDYGDSQNGADHAERLGPKRAVQSGIISSSSMKKAMIIMGIIAFVSGIILLLYSFRADYIKLLYFLILGLASIAAAVKYTAGKNPYGYMGLGDLFVFLFFGIVAVFGTYYLFTQEISCAPFVLSTAIGFLAAGVLNVNNIRDIDSDIKAGKKSVPVRLGEGNAKMYHLLLLLAAVLLIIWDALTTGFWWGILATPIFIKNSVLIYKAKNHTEYDKLLKPLAIGTFILSLGLFANAFLA